MITTTEAATEIATAYRELAAKPGAPVTILALYRKVSPAMTGSQLHAALREMVTTGGGRVHLETHAKLRDLTTMDRALAIRVGGEDKHTLSIL